MHGYGRSIDLLSHQADIVIGCESHLNDTYLTQEVFPSDYGVIRNDRNSSGGDVFLAIRNNLFFTEEPSFHGDIEIVCVKLCLDKLKPIYVCSFYRPPNTSMDPIIEFKHLLSDIFTQDKLTCTSQIIVIAEENAQQPHPSLHTFLFTKMHTRRDMINKY